MMAWARQELAGARLPDRRYADSLVGVAEGLAENGEESYSRAVGHAGRQAARRAFGHPEVTPDALLEGHFQQTGARCSEHRMVLVVQDTTDINYSGHKATAGLGPISERRESRGLMAHSALALTVEGLPLGVVHLDIWARDPAEHGKKHLRRQRSTEEKESSKWGRGLQSAQRVVPAGVGALVIQDREADVFAFIAQKRRKNVDLLVRASYPRRVELPDWVETTEGTPRDLFSVTAGAPVLGQIEVTIPRRAGQRERNTTLTVRAGALTVLPPANRRRSDGDAPQQLYVVQAREEHPSPDGEDPICWVLICTRPVRSLQEGLDLVRYYALRWTIERFHYVLKSGCRVERLQIDNVDRLCNALAVYYLVAWRLLHLTYLARIKPDAPAAEALAPDEITVLAAATNRAVTTIAEAVTAIAILGGQEHYRNAPPPGPKRLWLGIRRLEAMTEGWTLAARAITGCEPR